VALKVFSSRIVFFFAINSLTAEHTLPNYPWTAQAVNKVTRMRQI